MTAGGHTALSLAGGRWSPASFRQHCESHIGEDFQACVGLITRLKRNILDGPKQTLALWVIRYRFSNATWQAHTDTRVAAIVAAVPYAADFDMASLAAPRVPVGLVTAPRDKWLIPQFHGERVLRACAVCVRIADAARIHRPPRRPAQRPARLRSRGASRHRPEDRGVPTTGKG